MRPGPGRAGGQREGGRTRFAHRREETGIFEEVVVSKQFVPCHHTEAHEPLV